MTYYEILQVSENASDEVIHMAYKALAKKYHPDLFRGDRKFAEEKMKQINAAFEILSDKQKRAQYDSFLRHQKNAYESKTQENSKHQSTTNNPQKSKQEFVFPSRKKSGWIIGILLVLSYIQVWHPYAESEWYDYSFLLGMVDFSLLSFFLMVVPLLVCLIKCFSPKGIKILCAANSISIYIISLILYICELIPAMLIGWIVAIFYYFINKHILLQMSQTSYSKKKAIISSCIIILIIILTFVGSTYILKNSFNEHNSTNDDSNNHQSNEVEWISERDFFYYEDEEEFVLLFELSDKNENVITCRGTVEIKIINSDNVTVYNKTRVFNENNFEEWTYDNSIDKILASIYISPSDITKGTSSNGTVYFTVYGDDYYFDESTLPVYDLPIKPITLQLPSLPLTINDYGYSSNIQTTLCIERITYERAYEDSLYIYFSGEKTYDANGNQNNDWVSFEWKLYDSEGYLIDQGTFYTDSISVGDKFKDKSVFVADGIKPGENYKLVIVGATES